MTNMGICPNCKKVIENVITEDITLQYGSGQTKQEFDGSSYLCPSCKTVLSIGQHFISFKNLVIKELARELKKK